MRNLYLTNIPVEEALQRFQSAIAQHNKTENIAVIDALDRVTASAVYARRNSPLRNSAAMDGIAVIAQHTAGAADSSPLALKEKTDFLAVDTGDPIRPPYDAVIMAEDIQESDGKSVVIRKAATPWQHVRPVGEDIVQGEIIIPSGHKIRPIDVGALLSGGITDICVTAPFKVAIIPTGTEMTEPGDDIPEGGIIESNSRMLEGLVKQNGGMPTRFPPVPDEYDKIKAALQQSGFDMFLIIAGTSAGKEDYTVHVLREIGEVIVHGVAMKPGKPTILAIANGKPVIGIPGYPVSAFLAYENFAAPIISPNKPKMPTVSATLTRNLVSSLKHREYVRVRMGKVDNRLIATPLTRGAGAAMSLVRADGFCIIDQDEEGIQAGTKVEILLCRDQEDFNNTVVSIGSHDLILDILADMMPLTGSHVGSMGGLLALKNGEAHIAPLHLLDEETGSYNIPAIKRIFPANIGGQEMALIKGVGRIQGIITTDRNITTIEDLVKCGFINRQRGSGTRLLLDYKLKTMGISPSDIQGYGREAATHMAVAAAVKEKSADAGLGILSAARAMDLHFTPIGEEEYDFAIPAEFLKLPQIQLFIDTLKSDKFMAKLNGLGGYSAERCGEVVLVG